MNPFCPPGLQGNPHQPLRPWDDGLDCHTAYYVPVDHTQRAFEQFTELAGDAADLFAVGRLVIAAGPQGCGKTSLLNRCVWHLRESAASGVRTRLLVVDLTDECSDNQPVPERIRHVATMLIDELENMPRAPFDAAVVAELRVRLDDGERGPARMYRQLSTQLGRLGEQGNPTAVAVLLPASADLVDELAQYAGLVGPRLVFLGESSYLVDEADLRARIKRVLRANPVVLQLGPLRKDDCVRFTDNRMALHDGGGAPPLHPEVVATLNTSEAPFTVLHVQKILHGLYEFVLGREDRPEVVTQEHLTQYLLESWRWS